jgi:hypothetical protein
MGGKFHLKLNTGERPIANKYREGKMQRTLKRESKVLEIVKRETIQSSASRAWDSTRAARRRSVSGQSSLMRGRPGAGVGASPGALPARRGSASALDPRDKTRAKDGERGALAALRSLYRRRAIPRAGLRESDVRRKAGRARSLAGDA